MLHIQRPTLRKSVDLEILNNCLLYTAHHDQSNSTLRLPPLPWWLLYLFGTKAKSFTLLRKLIKTHYYEMGNEQDLGRSDSYH